MDLLSAWGIALLDSISSSIRSIFTGFTSKRTFISLYQTDDGKMTSCKEETKEDKKCAIFSTKEGKEKEVISECTVFYEPHIWQVCSLAPKESRFDVEMRAFSLSHYRVI